MWLESSPCILPRKFLPFLTKNEHLTGTSESVLEAKKKLREEHDTLIRKSKTYLEKRNNFDLEMLSILSNKCQDNDEVFDKLHQIWNSECVKEEEKSLILWQKKQTWLEQYRTAFLHGSDIKPKNPTKMPRSSPGIRGKRDTHYSHPSTHAKHQHIGGHQNHTRHQHQQHHDRPRYPVKQPHNTNYRYENQYHAQTRHQQQYQGGPKYTAQNRYHHKMPDTNHINKQAYQDNRFSHSHRPHNQMYHQQKTSHKSYQPEYHRKPDQYHYKDQYQNKFTESRPYHRQYNGPVYRGQFSLGRSHQNYSFTHKPSTTTPYGPKRFSDVVRSNITTIAHPTRPRQPFLDRSRPRHWIQ